MSGWDTYFGKPSKDRIEPLRTRERAAVEVARKCLRKICLIHQEEINDAPAIAGNALILIAQMLGERT